MRLILLLAVLALGLAPALAQSAAKPGIPPGRDPGGVAVAVIGSGVDYTLANIARRLARDGEGEAIAWDSVDNDNRPLDGGRGEPSAPGHWSDTLLAMLVLTDAPNARLVQVRVPWFDQAATARALGFVAKSPARIVLLLRCCKLPDDWPLIRDAAARFPDLLLVVPADAGRPLAHDKAQLLVTGATPGGGAPANVLVVGCVERDGGRCPAAFASADLVDIAVPGFARFVTLSQTGAVGTAGVRASAAVVAALAARIAEAEPALKGAGLKARIIALAKPAGAGAQGLSRHGILLPPTP